MVPLSAESARAMSGLRLIWGPVREAAAEILVSADALLADRRPAWRSVGLLILSTLASWFVYVPAHELLHALGCFAMGGVVTELQVAPHYGGRLLEQVFPFVRSSGEHAGRLSGFDTRGSDLTYLVTDFAPYLATIVGAIPLLAASRRRRSALLFGPGAVLAAAPITSVGGDFFEMAGILVSRALALLRPGIDAHLLRCDDVSALLGEFAERFPDHRAAWGLAILATLFVAWLLVSVTLLAMLGTGRRLAGAAPVAGGGGAAQGR